MTGACGTVTATSAPSTCCSAREPALVDAIEFDPGLRRIDVGLDLAFLVMELHAAERPDLADALVEGYRDAGGDPGDDRLLAFFAAYRARVRAKVALIRAAQLPAGAAGADGRASITRTGCWRSARGCCGRRATPR